MDTVGSRQLPRPFLSARRGFAPAGSWRLNRRMATALLQADPEWPKFVPAIRAAVLAEVAQGCAGFAPEWPPSASGAVPAVRIGTVLADLLWEAREGAAVTVENGGADWIALSLAASWGIEGRDDERLAWVQEREELWRRIAADPFNNTEWTHAPDPHGVGAFWQALAAVLAWTDYLDDGPGHVSYYPVSVTLTDRDVFGIVARRLYTRLEGLAVQEDVASRTSEGARWWLGLCDVDALTQLVGRPINALSYGGGREAFFGDVRRWLDAHLPFNGGHDAHDEEELAALRLRKVRVRVLSDTLWDLIGTRPVVTLAADARNAFGDLCGRGEAAA